MHDLIQEIKRRCPCQYAVLVLLFQDLRMKEIGYRLQLSPKTINTYASHIYEKFGVATRIGLILKITGLPQTGIIEEMLSGETQWLVTKQNGINTLSR
jgi:FixJ family two-component response regulator